MDYIKEIYTGIWNGGHIQGIATDGRYMYCSYTTEFVKLDMEGHVIGTVRGFTGHLGCMAMGPDGRVYASLEYKNDAIGQGILSRMGIEQVKDAFYIAIFDVEKIDRPDMNAETDGVMTTVWLREVVEDYHAVTEEGCEHRYGCSGIDGMTWAPAWDWDGMQLLVAYGIYSDVTRDDNDSQVLISYRMSSLTPYEALLTAENIHQSGPEHADAQYFVPTGNTTFGVQNMEYDPYTGDIFLAVYEGQKEKYPNFPMYVIDGSKAPVDGVLTLKDTGLVEKGIPGYRFPHGSTGMIALGDGKFYFSEHCRPEEGWSSFIRLYEFTGDPQKPFQCCGVTQQGIEASLQSLGLKDGDLVLFHSSLKSFGHVIGGADAVIDAFLSVVGPDGTVMVPTLVQKDFHNAYDTWYMDKPSDVGYITEVFRHRPEAVRSDQATHAVAAIGPLAHELTYEHTAYGERYGVFGDTAFSASSPWEKLDKLAGTIVLVGCDMNKNTIKHLMEYRLVESCLKRIEGTPEYESLKAEVWHHSRYLEKGIWPFYDGVQFQKEVDAMGMIRHAWCGNCHMMSFNAKEICDYGAKTLAEEPEKWFSAEVVYWMRRCKEAGE